MVWVKVDGDNAWPERAVREQGMPNPIVVVVRVYGQQVEVMGNAVLEEELYHIFRSDELLADNVGHTWAITATTMRCLAWLTIYKDAVPQAILPDHSAVQHPWLPSPELHEKRRLPTCLDGPRCIPKAHHPEQGTQYSILPTLRANSLLVVMAHVEQERHSGVSRPLVEWNAPSPRINVVGHGADVMLATSDKVPLDDGKLVRAWHLDPLYQIKALQLRPG
mmetsp:Transcript_73215/g.238101  ORF Transcript_73215/g.238101 Transcript_73215/m.238101 type:complete len:221 (-) Transcript_73215:1136-1798(-)